MLFTLSICIFSQEWIHLGPESTIADFVTWHPEEENIIFATYQYSVFKTDNQAETWQKLFTLEEGNFANISFMDIQFDPSDSQIMYLMAKSNNINSNNLAGLYKSTDGGNSFNRVLTTNINGFKVHPVTGRIVVYANTTNVHGTYPGYISDNQGDTWNHRVLFPATVKQFTFDAVNDEIMYVTSYQNNGVLKTTDGGLSWQNTGLEDLNLNLCVAHPENPGELWVGTEGFFSAQEIYFSADYGQTWSLYELPYRCDEESSVSLLNMAFGANPDFIYILGANEIFYSHDGGIFWETHVFQDFYGSFISSNIAIKPSDSYQLILFTEYGAIISLCGAVNWTDFKFSFGSVDIIDTVANQNGGYYLYSGNNYGLKKFNSSNETWEDCINDISTRKSFSNLLTDSQEPDLVIIGYSTFSFSNRVEKSFDSGENFDIVWAEFSYITQIKKSPLETGVYYMTTIGDDFNSGLFRSDDYGSNWASINSFSIDDNNLSGIEISYLNPNLIYVFNEHGVLKSLNRTNSFEYKNTGLPGIQTPGILSATISPFDDQVLLIALNNGVYRTSNGAEMWTQVLSLQAKKLSFQPVIPGLIFCLTLSNEILVSYDEGLSWNEFSGQYPDGIINDFTFSPDGFELIIATQTCGVFKTAIDAEIIIPVNLSAQASHFNVSLSWNNVPGARKYGVYRNNLKIAETDNEFYNDYYLLPGQYSYSVTTIHEAFESDFSNSSDIIIEGLDLCPPFNLSSQKVEFRDILLIWEDSLNEENLRLNSLNRDIIAYNIYRNGSIVHTVEGTEINQYLDSGLEFGFYNYAVTAVYSVGESVPSNSSTIVLENPFCPPHSLICQVNNNYEVVVSWQAPDFSDWCGEIPELIAYSVYRHEPYDMITYIYDLENPEFIDNYIDFDIEYTYSVKAIYNNNEESVMTDSVSIFIANPYLSPVRLSATNETLYIKLDWAMSANSLNQNNQELVSFEKINKLNRVKDKKAYSDRVAVLTGFNVYRNGEVLAFHTDLFELIYYDTEIEHGEYIYSVTAVYYPGIESSHSNEVSVFVENTSDSDCFNPLVTKLSDNYPNPFNPETRISFSLDKSQNVSIEIYNIKGQKVKTLVNGELPAKNHVIIWRGDDDFGKSVGSGVYFYKMKTGNYTETKKMLMLK